MRLWRIIELSLGKSNAKDRGVYFGAHPQVNVCASKAPDQPAFDRNRLKAEKLIDWGANLPRALLARSCNLGFTLTRRRNGARLQIGELVLDLTAPPLPALRDGALLMSTPIATISVDAVLGIGVLLEKRSPTRVEHRSRTGRKQDRKARPFPLRMKNLEQGGPQHR
jgi:hypothetical protein